MKFCPNKKCVNKPRKELIKELVNTNVHVKQEHTFSYSIKQYVSWITNDAKRITPTLWYGPDVTENFDPPENPGPGPNFTEKVGTLTQKTSYFLLEY